MIDFDYPARRSDLDSWIPDITAVVLPVVVIMSVIVVVIIVTSPSIMSVIDDRYQRGLRVDG